LSSNQPSGDAAHVESYSHRVPGTALWILAIGFCWLTWRSGQAYIPDSSIGNSIGVLVYGLNAGVWTIAGWNHRRPVLEISDSAIVFGNVVSLRRTHLPLEEVVGVIERTPGRFVLDTSSGGRATIRLSGIAKSQRSAARAAIERRIASANGGAP